MRFVYCACAISEIINDWRGVNTAHTVDYISRMQSYEGGMAMDVDQEGHTAITYCALASLTLLKSVPTMPGRLIEWLVQNQSYGFRSRTGKSPDCCYSFWLGASLELLGASDLIETETNIDFVMS
jgi:geranylgeranyl transferase type-1 subunit beta